MPENEEHVVCQIDEQLEDSMEEGKPLEPMSTSRDSVGNVCGDEEQVVDVYQDTFEDAMGSKEGDEGSINTYRTSIDPSATIDVPNRGSITNNHVRTLQQELASDIQSPQTITKDSVVDYRLLQETHLTGESTLLQQEHALVTAVKSGEEAHDKVLDDQHSSHGEQHTNIDGRTGNTINGEPTSRIVEDNFDVSPHAEHKSEEDMCVTFSGSLSTARASIAAVDNITSTEAVTISSQSRAVSPKASPTLQSPSVSSGFMGSLAGKLPGFHTSTPLPSNHSLDKKFPPNLPSNNTRKATGPFSWLTRKETATSKEPIISPSALPSNFLERRNTQASLGSDTDLSKRDNEDNMDLASLGRNNLKDRFKLLRMREEAGISLGEDADDSLGAALARSAGLANPQNEQSAISPGFTSPGGNVITSSTLAADTVAGVTAGLTTAHETVDWDLWQAVVYEGPAVVSRTSPAELTRAIALGIPGTIRGVVWQVLARSKNDNLESVYRDLVSRGTDKEKDRSRHSSSSTAFVSHASSSKDTKSSASSVHSDDHNTFLSSATTHGPRSPSPTLSPHKEDPEASTRTQSAASLEHHRKLKEDAAHLTKLEKAIRRDLGARTSFSKFAASAGLQDGLFGICKAYALFDEGVGYAQGMNFLVMPLLFNMPEEEAFCLLVRLMNQYHLRDLFIHDMPGLHMHLYQFERLLEDLEPALYCHLNRRQVTPHLYATQWFLTLFAYRFPLQLVLRIYDLILSEGLEAILKFGIVLMQKNVASLLAINDMAALTTFLRDKLFDTYIDQSPSTGSILDSGFFGNAGASIDKEIYRADMLVQDACKVKITQDMLKTYAKEWEEKTKAEKALSIELEALKSSNVSLVAKIRRLEERVQEHDSEHAALATELVRTKVENEELKDQNESLNGQVIELRIVVEKQPGEVEDRLKQEMDRLMVRNQEVHSDNTRLEEDLVEMEKSLVQTKMAYAEIKEENENIKQRLSNMRKALE